MAESIYLNGQLIWFLLQQSSLDGHCTKMKFPIKDFSSKCDQISSKLRIWSRLLDKFVMENFIFCVVGFQKESPEVFYKKSCSLKFININWKTPVFESQVFMTATLLKRGSNIGFFL